MELSKEQTDAITRLNETGVVFEFPDFETVIIKQTVIILIKTFTNKQLYIRANEVFPTSRIIPIVYGRKNGTI
jgi:hypothetical protein|nr:hypothetical protein [uncultured Flavobacterium sp.]